MLHWLGFNLKHECFLLWCNYFLILHPLQLQIVECLLEYAGSFWFLELFLFRFRKYYCFLHWHLRSQYYCNSLRLPAVHFLILTIISDEAPFLRFRANGNTPQQLQIPPISLPAKVT